MFHSPAPNSVTFCWTSAHVFFAVHPFLPTEFAFKVIDLRAQLRRSWLLVFKKKKNEKHLRRQSATCWTLRRLHLQRAFIALSYSSGLPSLAGKDENIYIILSWNYRVSIEKWLKCNLQSLNCKWTAQMQNLHSTPKHLTMAVHSHIRTKIQSQGATSHTGSSLGLSVLPKGTSTCRHLELRFGPLTSSVVINTCFSFVTCSDIKEWFCLSKGSGDIKTLCYFMTTCVSMQVCVRALRDAAAATAPCWRSSRPACPPWPESVRPLETTTVWEERQKEGGAIKLPLTVLTPDFFFSIAASASIPDRWGSALQSLVELQALMGRHSPVSATQHQQHSGLYLQTQTQKWTESEFETLAVFLLLLELRKT